jgi:phage tail sheath gpL-like
MAVDDVYPRRNLPGTAEDWGRALETDVVGTKKALEIVGQNIGAQNRATAASLQELSRQIVSLPVTLADSDTVSPISSTTLAWVTKATVNLTVPENKTSCVLFAGASLALLDTVTGGIAAPPYARILVESTTALPISNGVPATKDAGASNVNNVVSFSGTHSLSVTPGDTVTVELQVQVYHASAYGTASSSNFATLAVQATFSP